MNRKNIGIAFGALCGLTALTATAAEIFYDISINTKSPIHMSKLNDLVQKATNTAGNEEEASAKYSGMTGTPEIKEWYATHGEDVYILSDSLRLHGKRFVPEYIVVKAGIRAEVAGGAVLFYIDHERIPVAIRLNVHDMLHVAGGFALAPKLLAGAGPEAGSALCKADGKAFAVHISKGQHFAALCIHHNGGDEAVCVEFQFVGVQHVCSFIIRMGTPASASARFKSGIFTSPKWKMEAASPASTLGSV